MEVDDKSDDKSNSDSGVDAIVAELEEWANGVDETTFLLWWVRRTARLGGGVPPSNGCFLLSSSLISSFRTCRAQASIEAAAAAGGSAAAHAACAARAAQGPEPAPPPDGGDAAAAPAAAPSAAQPGLPPLPPLALPGPIATGRQKVLQQAQQSMQRLREILNPAGSSDAESWSPRADHPQQRLAVRAEEPGEVSMPAQVKPGDVDPVGQIDWMKKQSSQWLKPPQQSPAPKQGADGAGGSGSGGGGGSGEARDEPPPEHAGAPAPGARGRGRSGRPRGLTPEERALRRKRSLAESNKRYQAKRRGQVRGAAGEAGRRAAWERPRTLGACLKPDAQRRRVWCLACAAARE